MKIHAIDTGTVQIKQRQVEAVSTGVRRRLDTLTDRTWTDPLPIYAWAIEHPSGVIVVDTGETARAGEAGYFPRWHPYYRGGVRFDVTPDDEVGPQLRRLGIEPADVRAVVLTHLHTDHAGGLHHFPDTDIYVTEDELSAASGLSGRIAGYLNNRWPAWFDPRTIGFESGPLGPFPESMTLPGADDIRVVPTPGHSRGHASVIVDDGGVQIFLAGDVSYTLDLMLAQKLDGVAPDEDDARTTLRRTLEFARSQPTVYLPCHDPDSGTRLEGRTPAAADS